MLKSAKKDDSNLAREIHHHRQFVHPHIARLYEVVVTESLVWMVMEYCSGRSHSSAQREPEGEGHQVKMVGADRDARRGTL